MDSEAGLQKRGSSKVHNPYCVEQCNEQEEENHKVTQAERDFKR